MFLKREPCAALRPFVKMLWAVDESVSPWDAVAVRERMLPSGDTHIAVRLCNSPVRLFDGVDDSIGETIGHAVIGGPRAAIYVRDISRPVCTVGANIRSGAARFVFGLPADELACRHTRLDEVWGPAAESVREQLLEACSIERRIDILESALLARCSNVRRLHPAVAHALERLPTALSIREVVEQTGYSHRRFIALFREEIGLSPKVFCRVRRFQRLIGQVAADPKASWSELALNAGYSDQSHFNREFREFSGVTPEFYRSISPFQTNHVPVLQ